MKKYLLSSLLFALPVLFRPAIAQTPKQFMLKGKLSSPVDSALIIYTDSSGNLMRRALAVTNNDFSCTGEISQPTFATILFKKTGEVIPPLKREGRTCKFYLDPGVAVTVTGNPDDVTSLKFEGSKSEVEFEQFNAALAAVRVGMTPIDDEYVKETDPDKKAETEKRFASYQDRMKQAAYQFFVTHPHSFVTLTEMRYYISRMGIDSVKLVYNHFTDEQKETVPGKDLAGQIREIESGMPGAVAFCFTKTDVNGNPLSLADFRGKYVLLDFWASWCAPCRKGNPHMVSLYNKYKDQGFDIISVSDDDRAPDAWRAAIEKDSIGIWHHVLRGLEMQFFRRTHRHNPEDLDPHYGISSLPTKILIDPNGKIIGRYDDSVGSTDEDMDKMLTSIFNKGT